MIYGEENFRKTIRKILWEENLRTYEDVRRAVDTLDTAEAREAFAKKLDATIERIKESIKLCL